MDKPIKFLAAVWKVIKDHDGEVKITLAVSQTQASELMSIPVGENLEVTIEKE